MSATIDFKGLAERADLRRLIEDDCGDPGRNGRYHCPFHTDHWPDLAYYPITNRYKCYACQAKGDALDWLTECPRRRMTIIEAAKYLGADIEDGRSQGVPKVPRPTPPPRPPVPERPPAWADDKWQSLATQIIADAVETLWGSGGRDALRYLKWRGLADHTIRRFAIGFNPRSFMTEVVECLGPNSKGQRQGIYVTRGIVIPFIHPDAWYTPEADTPQWAGANVRCLMPDVFDPIPKDGPSRMQKYMQITGSQRGDLYPWPRIEATQGSVPAVIVEGELDALIGNQEAGHIAHVCTVGGSSQSPSALALESLGRCPGWLLATDNDESGAKAAWAWRERAPEKTRRARLPIGKDLAEFHQAGESVADWVTSEFGRVGWT